MIIRPMLFSGSMVTALLREVDPKNQTRRTRALDEVNACPGRWNDVRCFGDTWSFREMTPGNHLIDEVLVRCPYGVEGDGLWVRETVSESEPCFLGGRAQPTVWYRADNNRPMWADRKWTPSIHCPRRLSRITLEIQHLRIERLWAISEDDAKAEGCTTRTYRDGRGQETARIAYRSLWMDLNGSASWDANPWVWVVGFQRVAQP